MALWPHSGSSRRFLRAVTAKRKAAPHNVPGCVVMPVSNRFQDVRGDDSGRQAQRSADACGGLCRRAAGRRRSGSAVFIRAQRAEARRDRPAREPPGPGAGGPAARGRKRPDRHGGQRSDRAAKHDAPLGLPPDVYGDAPLRHAHADGGRRRVGLRRPRPRREHGQLRDALSPDGRRDGLHLVRG